MSSKAKTPRVDYKSMQKSIKQWYSEAESTRTKQLSATQARLAASGARPGTPYWMKQMQRVEDTYAQDIQDIEKSATYKAVSNWEKDINRKEAAQAQETERQTAINKYLPGWSPVELAESGIAGMSIDEIKKFSQDNMMSDYGQMFYGQTNRPGTESPIGSRWWETGGR
jgi:hypothetical protein